MEDEPITRATGEGGADQGRLVELVRLFGKLGFVAFGGPAAHISMMHDEVVTRRRWMDDQHFLDLVGATNLIPGPNSTEMAMHVGHHRVGWRGLVTAGSAFILPAALIVGTLAWTYVRYGHTPPGEALLYGIKPVVIAIIVQALVRLARAALTPVASAVVAIGQFTPEPVFTTATFVGYLLGGLPGAVVATVAIFLPSFLFVAGLTRIVPRHASTLGAVTCSTA